jgi:hypothetical protein
MRRMKLIVSAIEMSLIVQLAQADGQPAKRITWTSGGAYRPKIAVDSSGNLHVVWYASLSGESNIYHKKSTDAGAT